MIKQLAVTLIISSLFLGLSGCQDAGASENPENAPESTTIAVEAVPTTEPTTRPTATPVPVPTPTPLIIYVEVTPTPGPPTPPPPEQTPTQEEGEHQGSDQNTTTTPTKTPYPTPTPRYRPAGLPESVGSSAFSWGSVPRVANSSLSMSAVIESQNAAPTQVQVFSALRVEDLNGGKCTTDRPIAFIAKGASAGSTSWQWEYCGSVGSKPLIHVDRVPWIPAATWETTLRPRTRTNDPYVYDWSMSAHIGDARVRALDYDLPAGWIILVWSGETLLAQYWLAR